ncbi:MAG TPA: glycosyltransferase family 87 protein [Gemmataceae bacterium]|nr:glycosyltransferase family 87 protein [Gemmataceae bacterium]
MIPIWLSLSKWNRWQRCGLALGIATVVVFGILVEVRSAYLKRRMGDLGVFVRTAWAVRSGEDIYTVTDPNGFHYHYPPLFAIFLVPLAEPPPGVDSSWTIPYPITVAIWYVLNVLCLAISVHWLASALEESPGGRVSPWALRLLPVLACLPPIGHTLMRGQVSLLLLLLLSGMAVALLRGRRGRAGLWLAGAICLKVIPAFLLLDPLRRRDGRCLTGCALGLVLGLAAIPAAVFGPARTWAYFQEWTHVLLWPALGPGTDQSRAKELIDVTATDSQSFQAVLHNTIHSDPTTRPRQPSTAVRCAHWLVGGFLTLATLWIGRRQQDGPAVIIRFGALVVLMLLLSPVCHLHYFCLSLPLAMGALAAVWNGPPRFSGRVGMLIVLVLHGIAQVLPHLPRLQVLRDGGLATYATLLLWLSGMILLWKRGRCYPLALPREQPVISEAAA